MDIEDRIKVLEEEFQETKKELNQILLDIRICLMEAQSPLRADLNTKNLDEQGDAEKEVESHGS